MRILTLANWLICGIFAVFIYSVSLPDVEVTPRLTATTVLLGPCSLIASVLVFAIVSSQSDDCLYHCKEK